MIGASYYSDQGKLLWLIRGFLFPFFTYAFCSSGCTLWTTGSGAKKGNGDDHVFASILPPAGFDKYMKAYRFKHFRAFIPAIWAMKA
jgi:hypothetical protein